MSHLYIVPDPEESRNQSAVGLPTQVPDDQAKEIKRLEAEADDLEKWLDEMIERNEELMKIPSEIARELEQILDSRGDEQKLRGKLQSYICALKRGDAIFPPESAQRDMLVELEKERQRELFPA